MNGRLQLQDYIREYVYDRQVACEHIPRSQVLLDQNEPSVNAYNMIDDKRDVL